MEIPDIGMEEAALGSSDVGSIANSIRPGPFCYMSLYFCAVKMNLVLIICCIICCENNGISFVLSITQDI